MTSFRNRRLYRPGRRTVMAYCHDCNKEWEGSNVQGIAARHTDATGHTVCVEVTQCHIYYVAGKGGE